MLKQSLCILSVIFLSIEAYSQQPTPTGVPSASATPTPSGGTVPTDGPVSGSISPVTKGILLYLSRQDSPEESEGSCLTQADGRYSCPVSEIGYYLVRPANNFYTFSSSQFVALSGIESAPFTGNRTSTAPQLCRSRDLSVKINKANASAKNLSLYVETALESGAAVTAKVKKAAAKTKLHAALAAIENKAIVPFSAALQSSEDLPEVVLICPKKANCTKVSLKSNVKSFNKGTKGIYKIIKSVAKAVGKVKEGSKQSTKIAAKADKLLSKAKKAAAKLPSTTYQCS